MKKLLAVLMCLALCCGAAAMTAFADGDTYVVAGESGLCNGEYWAATSTANTMTANADGTYSLTVYNVQPGNYQFKIVKNGSEWIGNPDDWGNNYSFGVSSACTVTITYDPATGYATVSGSGIGVAVAPEITVMSIRGEGHADLDWDNGIAMTKVSEGVYEYTFASLENVELSIKFAANGNWNDYNFGGTYGGSGVVNNAEWSGSNIAVSVGEASSVTIRLDLTGLNYENKQGATFTVTVTPLSGGNAGGEETTQPTEPEVIIPKTADTTDLVSLTAAMLLSAAGLVVVIGGKKRF